MEAHLNRHRPFGEIYGNHADFSKARYEQDGFFFDPEGELLPGQDYKGVQAPGPSEGNTHLPRATIVGNAEGIEVVNDVIPGLVQLDEWLDGLKGMEARREALRYAKETLGITLPPSTKMEMVKQLIRSLYVSKAVAGDATEA